MSPDPDYVDLVRPFSRLAEHTAPSRSIPFVMPLEIGTLRYDRQVTYSLFAP